MASFDRVIAISKTVESYVNENYERYLKKPPRLIYRGSDQDYFSQNFAPSDNYLNNFFKKFPEVKNNKLISFPGRLSSWKGQESFIKLMSDLPVEYVGMIIGPYESAKPKYLKTLKKLIEDYRLQNRVFFYNAKDDIREIYYLSEVVLNLSSKPEPFGRTILEAAMMGKKIAGWDRGGPGEVLEMCFPSGKVEFNNFDALVTSVKKLCNSDEKPQNIFLTSDLMHSKTVSFYLDALDKNS
jgi:glycosyltransferase involved in cell wall biosynthesis